MALRTAGSVLVVFVWSVAVVLGQDGWSVTYTPQNICTLKGSTVELFCFYTYPRGHTVTTTFWFTKIINLRDDPDYKGRVTYRSDRRNGHTLRITELRESDSTEYKFRFRTDQTGGKYTGDPGVTLSVTGLQVKVTGGHQDKTLTCITTCILTDNPTYIWYKNGQHLDESTSPQYKDPVSSNYEDSYSCAVKGHEDPRISSSVCVQDQDCVSVTYTNRRICALKGSSVDISCTYGSGYDTITSSLWFSPNQSDSWRDELIPEDLTTDPRYAGREEYAGEKERGQSTLRITDLREEDSAEYKFIFNSETSGWGYSFPGTTLTVTGLQVRFKDPTNIIEGKCLCLFCESICFLQDNPSYIWYKNGQRLIRHETKYLILDPVSSKDAGRYSCAVENHEDLPSPEETLTVTYGPKNTSVSVSPSGEIVEDSSVTLTCSSDANPPVDKYTWYKKNVTSPKASGQSYSITNIISEDRGEYYCEAGNTIASNNSTALMIIIAAKQTSVLTAAVGIIVVVLVVILCLSGLWFRNKRNKSTSDTRDTADDGQGDSSPVYDNISSMAMTPTDNHYDVHYPRVHFSRFKNQEVPLYSTVQLPQPQKQEEDVQYAAVKFNHPSAAPPPAAAQAAEEDSSVVYSTVNKPRNKKT
ncbi:B-cell receptor CD22-like [Salvelinus fontinalis]|uniref:B-cell receptor CD22-like n=1 Tax=Salvelinus fontinalis TaxID=8038 RepID=UPI0024865B69|nr:B-cell receptor CD22-like [Salvelinus fontinalis]